ncbi:MAG: fumarylacetoacetate hydrolase family protein [Phycisphaerales bacterium]|jgi:2-keto-4-pentenoate hydratase/2-oxohepta-3-ene-1,7-dioic acid hydratase in catechol pathway
MARHLPPAILAIGRNYPEHAREMGGTVDPDPLVFLKNPASVIRDGEAIEIPPICREHGPQVDYEGELAVEIGRDCRDVPEARALEVVRAYRAANDVSARWWQKQGSGGQFCRGKSFDTFCPLSEPMPAASVGDPGHLRLQTRLNGQLVQDAVTAQMFHGVPRIIATLSRGMTLLEGTIILTGSPAGVGAARVPPVFLQDGDVVEVEIAGVGRVRNPVRELP